MKPLNVISLFFISCLFIISGCGNDTIQQIFNNQNSDLTRSGKFISFTSNKDGSYDIFLAQVDANGNLATTGLVYPDNPHNLTNSMNLADKQSNWSPNGRILVFSSKDMTTGIEQIYAFFFNADGSMDSSIVPHLLVNSNLNWDENPQFSPDGKYLVWDRSQPPDTHRDLLRGTLVYDSSNGHINITDVNSITNLTNTPTKDEYDPKWSPRISVQRIAYTYRSDTNSTDYEVWTMNPIDGSNNQVYYNPNRNGYPAWSPACDRIYFETDHGNSGLFFIAYLSYPNPSGNPNVLVQSNTLNLRYPTRLPNGSYIAYIRVGETSPGNGSIFVTSTSSGGNGNKLIPSSYGFDNADNLWPAW